MAKRTRRGRTAGGPRPPAQAAPAKPAVSALAQQLMQEAERENQEAERRKAWDDGPKPRAIRRYEKYSNMGG